MNLLLNEGVASNWNLSFLFSLLHITPHCILVQHLYLKFALELEHDGY